MNQKQLLLVMVVAGLAMTFGLPNEGYSCTCSGATDMYDNDCNDVGGINGDYTLHSQPVGCGSFVYADGSVNGNQYYGYVNPGAASGCLCYNCDDCLHCPVDGGSCPFAGVELFENKTKQDVLDWFKQIGLAITEANAEAWAGVKVVPPKALKPSSSVVEEMAVYFPNVGGCSAPPTKLNFGGASLCTVEVYGLQSGTTYQIDVGSTPLYQPGCGCDSQPWDTMDQGQQFYFTGYSYDSSCCAGTDDASGKSGYVCCSVLGNEMKPPTTRGNVRADPPPTPKWPTSFTAETARTVNMRTLFGNWLYSTEQNAEVITINGKYSDTALVYLYGDGKQASYEYNVENGTFSCNVSALNGSLYAPNFTGAKYIEKTSIRGNPVWKWVLIDGTSYYDNVYTAVPVRITTPSVDIEFLTLKLGEIYPISIPKAC